MNKRPDERPVLIGYDGSPASEQALRWAVEEARLRDRALLVCHAWHWPYPLRPMEDQALAAVQTAAASVLQEGVELAAALAEGLSVRPLLVKGMAAARLLEASRDATLVVLGSRGQGGFAELALGSAAIQVPAHADVPVIVVGPGLPWVWRPGAPVVVGVDGSAAGWAALRFALDEASLREAPLLAVCSWDDTNSHCGHDWLPFTDIEAMRRTAKLRFEEAVRRRIVHHPKVRVETVFVVRAPERALLEAADGAALLVLGDRGIGSAPQLPLGPVAQVALHRAPGSVAVVPSGPCGEDLRPCPPSRPAMTLESGDRPRR